MDMRCSASLGIQSHKLGPISSTNKIFKLEHCRVPVKRTPGSLQITASIQNKVFEDSCQGIVCYKDDSGQVICEGYDEGPRLQSPIPKTTFHPRDAEIMNILQRNWLEKVNCDEVKHAGIGINDLQEDFSSNGFNLFS